MIRPRSLASLVLLTVLAGCAAPAEAPVDPAALREAIQAGQKEWSAAFLAGDAAGVAKLYTEDGAQVGASGDWFRGREAITQNMQAQLDSLRVTVREDITEEVNAAGEYAFEIGHYSYQATSKVGNKPRSEAGRYMALWRKDADGVWRVHRDIGAPAAAKP